MSPSAVPPVCRIQDYGKFLYEKDKSDRAARKKQKIITIKEVKFSVTVDEHDYVTKKNKAVGFLSDGDKVKASLRFKGRQMAHRDLGYKIINRLIQDIGDNGVVEFMPRMEGTTLHAIIAPGKKPEVQKAPKAASTARGPLRPSLLPRSPRGSVGDDHAGAVEDSHKISSRPDRRIMAALLLGRLGGLIGRSTALSLTI